MTWAMHTIGFLDLNDEVNAGKLFKRSYQLYNREPFKIWNEAIPTSPGCGNFLTGSGGFLQSIINGYGGVRLHFDRMTIKNFYVPEGSNNLTFNGITYLGGRFSLLVTKEKATIKMITVNANREIVTRVTKRGPSGSTPYTAVVGLEISITRDEELIFEPVKTQYGQCELKATILGEAADGGSGKLTISLTLILLSALKYFI